MFQKKMKKFHFIKVTKPGIVKNKIGHQLIRNEYMTITLL